jgi:hypothetical protein
MNLFSYGVTAVVAMTSVVSLAAQRPGVDLDKDDITIRGCVTRAEQYRPIEKMPIIWSHDDVLLALPDGMDGQRFIADNAVGRLFYWLEDSDLSDHIGQMVEVKGDLEDVEKGEFEIERKDDFTTLQLKFDGKTEKARLPTPWFASTGGKDEREFDVVVQKVDVDDVKVLGACNR